MTYMETNKWYLPDRSGAQDRDILLGYYLSNGTFDLNEPFHFDESFTYTISFKCPTTTEMYLQYYDANDYLFIDDDNTLEYLYCNQSIFDIDFSSYLDNEWHTLVLQYTLNTEFVLTVDNIEINTYSYSGTYAENTNDFTIVFNNDSDSSVSSFSFSIDEHNNIKQYDLNEGAGTVVYNNYSAYDSTYNTKYAVVTGSWKSSISLSNINNIYGFNSTSGQYIPSNSKMKAEITNVLEWSSASPVDYGGMCMIGENIIFTPYSTIYIYIYNVRTKEMVQGPSALEYYFAGCCAVGSKVVMMPNSANHIGIYNLDTNVYTQGPDHGEVDGAYTRCLPFKNIVIMVPDESAYISTFDTSDNTFTQGPAHGYGEGTNPFSGACIVGDKVILAPYNSPNIGIYDITLGTYSNGPVHTSGTSAYSDCCAIGSKVYFVPANAQYFGVYDVENNTFEKIDIGVNTTNAFSSCIAIGDKVIALANGSRHNYIIDTTTFVYELYYNSTSPSGVGSWYSHCLSGNNIYYLNGTYELSLRKLSAYSYVNSDLQDITPNTFINVALTNFDSSLYTSLDSCVVGNKIVYAPIKDYIWVYNFESGETTAIAHGESYTNGAFSGCCAVGNKVIFAPYDSDYVGTFDVDTMTYTRGDSVTTGGVFKYCCAVGNKVIFNPYRTLNIGVYDVDTDTYTEGPTHGQGNDAYQGCCAVGNKVIFTPRNTTYVGIYNVDDNTFTLGPEVAYAYYLDGNGVAIGDKVIFPLSYEICVYNVSTNTMDINRFVGHGSSYGSVAFENKVYGYPVADSVGGYEYKIPIYDIDTDELTFTETFSNITDFAWTGASSMVLIGDTMVSTQISTSDTYLYLSSYKIPTITNNSHSKDILGNPLEYFGKAKYPLQVKNSNIAEFNGTDNSLSFFDLFGVTIDTFTGSSTPTINGDTIEFTAGDAYYIKLSNGFESYFSEGNGAVLYDRSGNNQHATITGDLTSFWSTSDTQTPANLKYGFDLWSSDTDVYDFLRVPLRPNNTSIKGDGQNINGYTWQKKYLPSPRGYNYSENTFMQPPSPELFKLSKDNFTSNNPWYEDDGTPKEFTFSSVVSNYDLADVWFTDIYSEEPNKTKHTVFNAPITGDKLIGMESYINTVDPSTLDFSEVDNSQYTPLI